MSYRQKLTSKYLFLFAVGGALYVLIELLWRGWSHWTMFALGGLCFVYLGLINEALGHAVVGSGVNRNGGDHRFRVYDWLCG